MDTKIQAYSTKNLKSKIDLLEWNINHDMKKPSSKEDEGDKDPCVLFGGIIENDNNEFNHFERIKTNKTSRSPGSQN